VDEKKLGELKRLADELEETLDTVRLATEVVSHLYAASDDLHAILLRVEEHPHMIKLVTAADQVFAGTREAFVNMLWAARRARRLSDQYAALLTGMLEDDMKGREEGEKEAGE
jgi:hypothetical protein